MRLCNDCIRRDVRCIAHREHWKCAKCDRLNVLCDLIVIAEKWAKFDFDRVRIAHEFEIKRRILQKFFKFAQNVAFEIFRLKKVQKFLRNKVLEIIVREFYNMEKMNVDEQRDDLNFSSVFDFFVDLNFFDSLLAVLMNNFFLSFYLNSCNDNRLKEFDNV